MRKSKLAKDGFEKFVNSIQRTLTKDKLKPILSFSFMVIAVLAFTNFGDKNIPSTTTLPEISNIIFSFPKKEFTDHRDQQKYPMLKINNRWWMGKNLNFKTSNSSCYNNQDECSDLGMLYTWDDAKTACPKNWRLPSEEEWSAMLRSAYGKDQACLNCYASLIENGISGFEGKLGGFKSSNGKSYFTENNYGYYWTGTASDALNAEYFVFVQPKRYVNKSIGLKQSGFSCRCILEEGKEPSDASVSIATPSSQPTEPEMTTPSTQPIKTEMTTPATQPTKTEISTPSTQPTKNEITTPSTQPTKTEITTPATQPAKTEMTTPSTQPAKTEITIPSTQPTKTEMTTPSTQPTKTEITTPATQPSKTEMTTPSAQPTKPEIATPATQPAKLLFKSGSFIDRRNNQTYPTVRIDGKWWMAENLNYPTKGSFYYEDDTQEEEVTSKTENYGLLYTWKSAQSACPKGWRLPSDDEWLEMTRYIGKSLVTKGEGVTVYDYLIVGGQSQFNAVFGGVREKGKKGKFLSLDELGHYWSSTKKDKKEAWFYGFSNLPEEKKLTRSSANKEQGLSCRCVRN